MTRGDEGSAGTSENVVDYPRLEQTIHKNHPHLVTIHNYYGNTYNCDLGDKEYSHWGEFENADGSGWPCYEMCVGTVMGSQFWTLHGKDKEVCQYTAEDMFRYTVLEASGNTAGGGVQWAAGPYTDGTFEQNVIESMEKVYQYMKPVEESVKGSRPSTSYVTKPGIKISDLTWGVATKSADDTKEYLHILIPPQSKILELPTSEDGKVFSNAYLLADHSKVKLTNHPSGLILELENQEWNAVDTVIVLEKQQ